MLLYPPSTERVRMPVIEKQRIIPRKNTIVKRKKTREEQVIDSLSPNLNLMIHAVRRASGSLLRDFGEISHLQVSKKGPGDFVSNADLMTEKKLIEFLQEARPDYGFVSEERGEIPAKNGSPYKWLMDPIDGTTNFLHAMPYFAISLALLKGDEVLDAVIFNPITNQLYYAEKGRGAFIMTPTGNERLRVSGRTKMETAMMSVNISVFGRCPELLESFLKNHSPVRVMGATTLTLSSLAAGQADAFIEYHPHIWDIATGYLMVKEAGGIVQSWSGKLKLYDIVEEGTFLATTPELKEKVIKILPKIKKTCK